MRDITYFTRTAHSWKRRYEVLRASFVERMPAQAVADRFGYTPEYIRLLRYMFKHEKIDFSETVPEGKIAHRRVTTEIHRKIRTWREKQLSAGEITQLLSDDGVEISIRTVERVLAEEGFPRLPRRTRIKLGRTVKGAEIPGRSEIVVVNDLNGSRFNSSGADVFLFMPFLGQLDINKVIQFADLPGSKVVPANNYLLSFPALKLLGTERYAHVGDYGFDLGL